MFARVARFTGAEAESLQKNLDAIREESGSGPPDGVPAKSLTLMADEAAGTVVAIALFETEEDLRKGDEVLNSMSPPEGPMGTRSSVDLCEVKLEVEAP
jgi:hypothetical protein